MQFGKREKNHKEGGGVEGTEPIWAADLAWLPWMISSDHSWLWTASIGFQDDLLAAMGPPYKKSLL